MRAHRRSALSLGKGMGPRGPGAGIPPLRVAPFSLPVPLEPPATPPPSKTVIASELFVGLLAPQLQAQTLQGRPGSARESLRKILGPWRWEEASEETPFGAAGSGVQRSRSWFVYGGLFVEERGEGRTPDGPYEWSLVTYYDADHRVYRSFFYDTSGAGGLGVLTLQGRTWTGTWQQQVDGMRYRCRSVTVYEPGGEGCEYSWAYSGDGLNWRPWLKGTGRREHQAG